MRLTLQLHPGSRCEVARGVAVEVDRDGQSLSLRYEVSRVTEGLVVPSPAAAVRTDGLWAHTCFEAFVAEGAGYREINLSPSGAWAAYGFDGYRAGMRPAEAAPAITARRTDDSLVLEARVDLDIAGPWRMGLSAVLEAADGSVSYWALAHPAGKPDFHHADCFALSLPAPV